MEANLGGLAPYHQLILQKCFLQWWKTGNARHSRLDSSGAKVAVCIRGLSQMVDSGEQRVNSRGLAVGLEVFAHCRNTKRSAEAGGSAPP